MSELTRASSPSSVETFGCKPSDLLEVLPYRVAGIAKLVQGGGNVAVIESSLRSEIRGAAPLHEMETGSSAWEEHIPQVEAARAMKLRPRKAQRTRYGVIDEPCNFSSLVPIPRWADYLVPDHLRMLEASMATNPRVTLNSGLVITP